MYPKILYDIVEPMAMEKKPLNDVIESLINDTELQELLCGYNKADIINSYNDAKTINRIP